MDSRLQTQSYRATLRRQFTFYYLVSRNYWHSFDRPRKDERLNRTWSHPGVLKTGTLDCQSRALTTRSLLHCTIIGQHLVLRHIGRPQTADPEIYLIFLFSKQVWDYFFPRILCIIFQKRYFLRYIPITDQISLSGCFLRFGKYVYRN